jgi:hypothetical protein
MTREELLDKAIYIQYPLNYNEYKDFKINKEIIKLPLPQSGMMYDGWEFNDHHFTTEYHRLYSFPLFCKIFELQFNDNDFILDSRNSNGFDISLLKPKKGFRYEVYGFTRGGEHFDDLSFDEITNNDSKNNDITDYHRLYRYSHECSRLINKTIENDRKLFISGDSQMIPDIGFLSCFFKEVWYFDNRNCLNLSDLYRDVEFTDVLIGLNQADMWAYLIRNLK